MARPNPIPQNLRLPPQNQDAERALLGAIMLKPTSLIEVVDIITGRSFYSDRHRLIYETMLELYQKSEPIDLLTLTSKLQANKQLERAGGQSYLAEIVGNVPTTSNASYYAELIHKKFVHRSLIQSAERISDLGFSEGEEVEQLLDSAEKEIFGISGVTRQKFTPIKDTLAEAWERLDHLHKSKDEIRGVKTGFQEIDNKLAGLQKSDLIILAARPSVGKTSLAMDIARNAAVHSGVPVGIFSLEMSSQQLVDRMLAAESYVDSWKLRTGRLTTDEEFSKIRDALDKLSQAPIFIDDDSSNTALKMRSVARRLKSEHGLGLIVVDYLQLMVPQKNVDSLVQQVTEISRSLKQMARELDVPVLALSQLSRAVEQRGGEPRLSDLRDSGCLTGDILIQLTDTGARVPIKDLVGKTNVSVLALDENKKLVSVPMTKVFSSGRKQVFLMRTKSGRSIKASANHPFLTIEGWRRLDTLAAGDHVSLPRTLTMATGANTMSHDELLLLAHLIGDGCVLPRQPIHYTSADKENLNAVGEAANRLFGITPRLVQQSNWWHLYLPSPYRLTHGKHHPITDWYRTLRLDAVRSYDKRLPQQLFTQSSEALAFFLKHLWATDGNISWKKLAGRQPAAAIYYTSTSKPLAEGVQHLLLRLGIWSSLRLVKTSRTVRDGYTVNIEGAVMQQRFLEIIGCFGERGKVIPKLLAALKEIKPNTNTDAIPKESWFLLVEPELKRNEMSWRGLAEKMDTAYNGTAVQATGISRARLTKLAAVLASKNLATLAESDVYWDEIAEIVPLGEEEVFDATVPKYHNFVANDMVVHNSIEQDADVVMFIHRGNDKDQSENDGQRNTTAKIIIAKHRNGPTGTCELFFDEKRVSFTSIDKSDFGGF